MVQLCCTPEKEVQQFNLLNDRRELIHLLCSLTEGPAPMDRAMQHSHCTAHAPDMNSLWMLRAQRSCPTHAFTSRAPQSQRWVSPQGALHCAI